MRLMVVATCSLNQWALDFTGNLERIMESIRQAKAKGAQYRLGPELEITGYGCEDHFLELDTEVHAWQCLTEIIKSGVTDNILCDIGMPVRHHNVLYNCRMLVRDGKILLIRPKMFLANDGNYRERRWFQAWTGKNRVEEHVLPSTVVELTGQTKAPFGDGAVEAMDTIIGCETCEELFTPDSPHIRLGLNGIEILGNGSGSHHELRKLHYRVDLIRLATRKCGGVYLYANQRGCDGGRLYYDGSCLIAVNGVLVAQGEQFGFRDVEVITAQVNVEDVRSFRGSINSRGMQASLADVVPRVSLDARLTSKALLHESELNPAIEPRYVTTSEEIGRGPACWLWDYLRRSGLAGFFLPLSGGADSSAVAAIVGCMCQMLVAAIEKQDDNSAAVLADVRRIVKDKDESWKPKDAKDLASRIFYTCYMGTEHSSDETRSLAKKLADDVGSSHMDSNIDEIVASFLSTFRKGDVNANALFSSLPEPKFRSQSGSNRENLALQNIQARSRMAFGYFLAQLLPWSIGRPGSLLVLASANVDEALRGYLTKYDCSAADLNPIGSVSKIDLAKFLEWAADTLNFSTLHAVRKAPPTAELEPRTSDYTQTDEADMGMTYAQLSLFGRMRLEHRCGPLSMFERLWLAPFGARSKDPENAQWGAPGSDPAEVMEESESARQLADRVKHFFFYYGINRHKATVLTPSMHLESYSPDDNRYDLRQFLYNSSWKLQFESIDKRVEEIERRQKSKSSTSDQESSSSSSSSLSDVKVDEVRAALAKAGLRIKDGDTTQLLKMLERQQ